ncbi:MAG: glycosyltransferase family 39 protein [Anaerolineales bacterium]|nr:glycosyltransferase family 39 protein [Anaerolineales bacterium]
MGIDGTAAESTLSANSIDAFLRRRWLGIPRAVIFLAGIVFFAALLRFVNLEAVGDGNLYYAAAVKSMLVSWENFFFAAAEPGGSVTVDKPPLGLWIQAISAALFGVNTFGLMLPQILAGLGSVVLMFFLVRRWSGESAGLLAAFILAVTPVSVAVERNNTMDAQLIFTLLLAVWMFILAVERHPRWLLLGGLFIGLAFNIKMLQAYLPVPFLFVYYFLASRERWLRRLLYLLLTALILIVVSFSWVVVVDSIPEANRPYIGSSENNTVMELIFGHNGLNRLFGRRGADSLLTSLTGSDSDGAQIPQQAPADRPALNNTPLPGGDRIPRDTITGQDQTGFRPPQGQAQQQGETIFPPSAAMAAGSPDSRLGSSEIGEPGLGRLFTPPLANEISWLLPLGLVLLLVLMVSSPLRLPLSGAWRAVVLWGGWPLTCVVFFSLASFFHAYYLAMLAPPLAAVAASGLAALWKIRTSRPWLAVITLWVLAVGTIVFQAFTAANYTNSSGWAWAAGALLLAGVIPGLMGTLLPERQLQKAGFVLVIGALLAAPVVWSVRTTLEENPNTGLPGAYSGEAERVRENRSGETEPYRLEFLLNHTVDRKYLLAVPGSMQGAEYVLAAGRPVLYIGGFNGGDPVVSLEEFQQLIVNGDLRYVLLSGSSGRMENEEIFRWVRTECTRLQPILQNPAAAQAAASLQSDQGILFDCIGSVSAK